MASVKNSISQQDNIIIIGMPGCGKTSIGRRVAELTGRTFLDTDELLAADFGITIPQTIILYGEEMFRQTETDMLRQCLMSFTGAVIVAGSGSILIEENRNLMKQYGKVIFLQRDIEKLNGGMLFAVQGIKKMQDVYDERLPIYQGCADYELLNADTVDDTVNKFLYLMQ